MTARIAVALTLVTVCVVVPRGIAWEAVSLFDGETFTGWEGTTSPCGI